MELLNLETLINKKYDSLQKFSRAIGISYKTCWNFISKGIGVTSFKNAIIISNALNISLEELAEYSDEEASVKTSHEFLSEHEKDLVLFYRQNPDKRWAFDKLVVSSYEES